MTVQTLLPRRDVNASEMSSFYKDCLTRGERPPSQPAFMWQDRLDHAFTIALSNEDDIDVLSNYYAELGRFRKAARGGAVALAILLHQGREVFPPVDEVALLREGVIQSSDGGNHTFLTSLIADKMCPYIFHHYLVNSDCVYIDVAGIAYAPLPHDLDAEGFARSLRQFQTTVASKSLESLFSISFCTVVSYGPFHILAAPLALRLRTDATRRLTFRGMTGEDFASWLIANRRLADYMDELDLLENIPDSLYIEHNQKIVVHTEPSKKRTLTEQEVAALVQRFEDLSETRIFEALADIDSHSQAKLLRAASLPVIRSEIFAMMLSDVIVRRCFIHLTKDSFYVGDSSKIASLVLECFFDGKPDSPLSVLIHEECLRYLVTEYGIFDPSEGLNCIRNVDAVREVLMRRLAYYKDPQRDPIVDEFLQGYNVSIDRLVFEPVVHVCNPLLSISEVAKEDYNNDQLELVMDISRTIVGFSMASLSFDERGAAKATLKLGGLYMRLARGQVKSEHRDLFLSIGAELGDGEVKAYCARLEEICQGLIAQAVDKLGNSGREILVASEGCRAVYERFKNYESLLPIMKDLVVKTEKLLGQVHGVYLGLLIRLGQTYVRSGADLQLREAAKIFGKAVGIATQLVELNLGDEGEWLKYSELADFSKMFFAETQALIFKFHDALKLNDEVSRRSIGGLLQRCLILRDYVATLAGTSKYAEALSSGAKWRRALAELQQKLEVAKVANWRVFVAAERLRCEIWLMDKATVGDLWDALLLYENPKGALAGVSERPGLVKQVLEKYMKEPTDYNENKAERRIFLWEEGTRKLQVLDSSLKEAAELLLLRSTAEDGSFEARETDAAEFLKYLMSGDSLQRSIAVHVFACCSWVLPRLFGSAPTDKRLCVLGPIAAIDELKNT